LAPARLHRSGDDPLTGNHPFHTQLPPHTLALSRFAMKLTANEHRAEDLVQETFLKAWANRDKFALGTELRGWLFTILRNTFYSDLRKYRRETEDVDGKLAALLFAEPAQEHAVELKELISAIARLPEIHRRPLVLMGVYGFSQLESADVCGCTVGTIKSRVSRARSSLGHAFGREDEEGQAGAHAFHVHEREAAASANHAPRPVRDRRRLRPAPARPPWPSMAPVIETLSSRM